MMAFAEDGRRWICPTDRELTLRAKLNSGWSVHTQDTFLKPTSILAPELRSIENVLERAKIIDLLEKERIEKLVCRLENLKRNAVGDGKKCCFMCGSAFGIFRNQPSNCADCFKAVCEKCRIDIRITLQEVCLLCKICAENREVWKKSGGWFYGEVSAPVNCTMAFNTWEHKKPDIVRLESFKAHEENYSEVPLYKNWATNSSPDLSSLDEENAIFQEDLAHRNHSDSSGDELELSHLSPPVDASSQLSLSCPSLQEASSSSPRPQYKQAEVTRRHRRIFSRKRFFTPAKRAIERITTKSRKSS